jgi:hypothetical protein
VNDTPTETEVTSPSGLDLLRVPFPEDQISKLPRVSCKACRDRNCTNQDHRYIKCQVCKAWITSAHIHLDYVGHAEITDRLLNADPHWYWEPLAVDERGLPAFDRFGGLWIKLTVCGVTRLGYGDAKGKEPGGDAIKEAIGDALRNAAMRFGAGLDLWAKSDLHAREADAEQEPERPAQQQRQQQARPPRQGAVQRTRGPAPGDEQWQTPPPTPEPPELPDPTKDYKGWLDAVSKAMTEATDQATLGVLRALIKKQVDAGILGGPDREVLVNAYTVRWAELGGNAARAV